VGVSEKELEEIPKSTVCGTYIMDIELGGGAVELNMASAARLLGCGGVRLL